MGIKPVEPTRSIEPVKTRSLVPVTTRSLVAASSRTISAVPAPAIPKDARELRRLEADRKLDEWIDVWGEPIAAAIQNALKQALKEITPTPQQETGVLAAGRRQKIQVRCLTASQRVALTKHYGEWLGTLEGSLEDVITDAYGNIAERAGIPIATPTWGLRVPDSVLVTSGFAEELTAKLGPLEAEQLPGDLEREVVKRIGNHQDYWSNQAEINKAVLDAENFVSEADRRQTIKDLEFARQQLGLESIPKYFGQGEGGANEPFFFTKNELVKSFRNEVRDEEIAKVKAENAAQQKALERLDKAALKDFTRLVRAFNFGYTPEGSLAAEGAPVNFRYLRYEDAMRLRRIAPGGRLTYVQFQGLGLTDITPDVDTLLSLSKGVSEAEREIARQRIERFLQANLRPTGPAVRASTIKGLLNDKQFLRALVNPQIIRSVEEKGLVGLTQLDALTVRRGAQQAISGIRRNSLESLVRQIDDAVCSGKTFEEALADQAPRAEGIAKDVAHQLMNETTQEMAKDPYLNDQHTTKVWICQFINSRIWHEIAHGQRRQLDESFWVGLEQMQYPLDPAGSVQNVANCRCRVAVIVKSVNDTDHVLSLVDDEIPPYLGPNNE